MIASLDKSIYVYEIRSERLNGKDVEVTVISPSAGTSSDTFLVRFGRVAASS